MDISEVRTTLSSSKEECIRVTEEVLWVPWVLPTTNFNINSLLTKKDLFPLIKGIDPLADYQRTAEIEDREKV